MPRKSKLLRFGPTPDEVIGISKSLRDIPNSALKGMEFYEYGWDVWGTKSEVGYFLPRLLEYLANDPDYLDSPGLFGLFQFKLYRLFSDSNTDWTKLEKNAYLILCELF